MIKAWISRRGLTRRYNRQTLQTISGTTHLILVAWCAFRMAALGKAIADSSVIVGSSSRPGLIWALLVLVLLESVVLFVALVRDRRSPPTGLIHIDVAMSAVVALSPLFSTSGVPSPQLPWHFALVFTTICLVAMRMRSSARTAVAVGVLGALYLVGRASQSAWSSVGVAVASGFTVLMVFAAGAAFARLLMDQARRIEMLLETNIRLAARAAVANERATQRVFLHDTAGLLAMIANTTDPDLSAVLRDRARSTSKELRAYVYEERQHEARPSRSLPQVIERIAAEFADLPIAQNTLLAKNVFLTSDQIQSLESALRTLLDNVRVHAQASSVIIHGRSANSSWEVTVRDDGIGFDPDRTKKGFGLRDQVESQCALAGISVRISSYPGDGTEVRLSGTAVPMTTNQPGIVNPAQQQMNVLQQWRAVRRQPSVRR